MSMWDDEAGYDRDNPKHPDWAGAMFDKADMDRKRLKEQAADDAEKNQRESDHVEGHSKSG